MMSSSQKRSIGLCCLALVLLLFPLNSHSQSTEVYLGKALYRYDINFISYDCKKVADAAALHAIYFDPTQGYVCTPLDQACDPNDANACGGVPADLCGGFKVCVGRSNEYYAAAAVDTTQGICVQVSATNCAAAAAMPGFQEFKECNDSQCKTGTTTYKPSAEVSIAMKGPMCYTVPKPENTVCHDADPCTTSHCGKPKVIEYLSDKIKLDPPLTYSECESENDPKACDEEFQCKVGTCDPKKDGGDPCGYDPAEDGTPCEGDNQCKKYACAAGSCVEKESITVGSCQICDPVKGIFDKEACCSTDAECNDGEECTDDKCEANACKHTAKPDTTVLSELGDCNQVVCQNGKKNTVVKPEPVAAPPPCNKWDCQKNSANKWEYIAKPIGDGPDSSCASDLYCQPKECKAGACQAIASPPCNDKNPNDCVEWGCDENLDACTYQNKPNCCDADADCALPADLANSCASATCDMATKTCKVQFVAVGTDCPSSNPANKCVKAACDGSGHCGDQAVVCDPDSNGCTDDYCDPATGNCVHPVDMGGSCDDGNPCTIDDHCDLTGACISGGGYACAPPVDDCLEKAECKNVGGGAHCEYEPKPNCCKTDLDCGAPTDCQTVTCKKSGGPTGTCEYAPLSGSACGLGDDCGECSNGACKPKAAPADEICKSYVCEKGKYLPVPSGAGTPCSGSDACKEYECNKEGACVEKPGATKEICPPPPGGSCPGGNCPPPPGGPGPGTEPDPGVKTGVQPNPGAPGATQSFLQGSGRFGCSVSGTTTLGSLLQTYFALAFFLALRRVMKK